MLWKAVERIIPDIRQRTEIEMVRLLFHPDAHGHILNKTVEGIEAVRAPETRGWVAWRLKIMQRQDSDTLL